MNLKESYRYHNFLDTNISTLISYLRSENNVIKVSETHQKSKSNQDVQDEVIDATTERQYNCKIEDITFLVKQLVEEKLKLSLAIEDAKKNITLEWIEDGRKLTLDSAIEFNKNVRNMTNNLKYLVDLKSSEYKKTGKDYKFNVNGDQVPYQYNIEIKKESFRNSFCNFSTLILFIIFFDMKNPTDILIYMKLIVKTIIGVSWKIYVI